MNDPRDDFIDALTYQVKEEVINNYLRERLILEEEINEYHHNLSAYREIEDQTRKIRDELACLLVTPQNFRLFFGRLGFGRPPLTRLGHGDVLGKPPTCPVGLTPRGFTKRGRYLRLVMDTYRELYELVKKGQEAAKAILALAEEINQDIKKFHLYFDVMAITNFLKSLDVTTLQKKKFLGQNFTAAELASLDDKMVFKKISPLKDGVRTWPEFPPTAQAEKLTGDLLSQIFRQERGAILPAIRRNG
ncbi:MAG: hypothetical protein V1742_12260 [Pseudomonadota bacterium]